MIDGGIEIAHQDVKIVGGVAVFRACRPRRWRPMSVVGSPSPMTGQAHTHNFTRLDAAADRGSVPTTDFYGDPIAVNNAGTILSETEVSPLLWNVDPTD